jgi:tryptophan synthase alpha subunit
MQTPFEKNRCAFISFVMAGHPTIELSIEALLVLQKQGADLIELGVPFSDPIADGSVIQEASQIAIEQGMTLSACFDLIMQARKRGLTIPIVLFSYFNPILAYGLEAFILKLKEHQVAAVLIVDLPYSADCLYAAMLAQHGIKQVALISPTTPHERITHISNSNPYFIYYISRIGITGAQENLSDSLATEIMQLRKTIMNTPIAVGFGISKFEHVHAIKHIADGVILGSALVKALQDDGLVGLTSKMRALYPN